MTNFKKRTSKEADYVRKLDNEDNFNEIPSNIKRARTLKPKDFDRYQVWYNYFKDNGILQLGAKDSIGWVVDHWKTILKHIQDTYKPPEFLDTSRRHHIEGLGNVLLSIDKVKFREIVRPFFNEGKKIQITDDLERLEGKLKPSKLQNFVSYPSLVKERDKLYQLWMNEPRNKKFNIYHLIIAVNTYIPPLRRQWHDMLLYNKKTAPPNDDINYLWQYEKGKWAIVMNYDKIENKRVALGKEREIFFLEEEIQGVTNGTRLNEIINKSLIDFPRKWVLSGIRTGGLEPMAQTSYDQGLASVFSPRAPTTNILRKSFINHWHRQNLSPKVLGEIARHMRHTLSVASTMYRKVNIDEYHQEPIQSTVTATRAKKEIEPPVEKECFNPAEYMRQYREKNAEKIQAQRKQAYERNRKKVLGDKILRGLNCGATERISQQTKDVYGIYYDEKSKQWKMKEQVSKQSRVQPPRRSSE